MTKPKNENKTEKRLKILSAVFTFAGFIIICGTLWLLNSYDKISIDQILFQVKAPAAGTNTALVLSGVGFIGGGGLLLGCLAVLIFKGIKKSRLKKGGSAGNFIKSGVILSSAVFGLAVLFFVFGLNLVDYFSKSITRSNFIEEHYVDIDDAEIEFPKQKRNLIYIYLESMENTYMSEENGGVNERGCIPELTKLALENINFSNTSKLGGAESYTGTTWTASAMVAHTSGMPVKVPLNAQNYGGENRFMPGIKSLGELLEREGYTQVLTIGSDSAFAGRSSYFSEHGNYIIHDINYYKSVNKLPHDYKVWWGFEDDKLFTYAKEELTELGKSGQPFNYTLLTADTHFPDGYVCKDCENKYGTQYENVLACSSKRVYEFIEWLKQQPFYENTTIILTGDHLTMDPDYMRSLDENCVRTVYNCFINASATSEKTKNRSFGTFDMFPTTLSAMGVKIKGNRLGLGTDLFSGAPTLAEEYGFDTLDTEIQKNSEFYNKHIIEK